MPEFIITCDVPFSVRNNGNVFCSTNNTVTHEHSKYISDLSASEIGELSSAVLILFSIAFVFKQVRRQFF